MQNLSMNSYWLFPTLVCAYCNRVLPLERNLYLGEDKKFCSSSCRREILVNKSPPLEQQKIN